MMTVEIRSVADKGLHDKERLIFNVTAATDIGAYALLQTGFDDDTKQVTIRVYNTFWFPYKKVTAGDLIVLYTKAGTANEKVNEETGRHTYFYYWGLGEPIWGTTNRAAVILHAPEWKHKPPNEL